MYAVARLSVVVLLVAAVAPLAASPLGAQPTPEPACRPYCNYGGENTGSGFNAAAAYVSIVGAGSNTTDSSCIHPPGGGSHPTPVPGHISVASVAMPGSPDTFLVIVRCNANDPGPTGSFAPHLLTSYQVTRRDPADLLEEALAALDLDPPTISTSPGGGDPSLVGIDTWLIVEDGSWGDADEIVRDGFLAVHVWADPAGDGSITWDTGEGTVTCGSDDTEGDCAWEYSRSSVNQPDDMYAITASATYTGGYSVLVGNDVIAGPMNLGDVVRTSDPYYLAVEEAQAINTDG